MSNRLAGQSSPYLRQHADNPVDWWPWCDEAFEDARRRDLPVLVSIGYSSCHWCHVMAHESFEDPDTASQMNEEFVNIKVDREERPDIDSIYMGAVTAMTGHGGWPMTVFLDGTGQPFFGGTYFPPDDTGGMPSFRSLMSAITDAWRSDRAELEEQASRLVSAIQAPALTASSPVDSSLLDLALDSLCAMHDPVNGGFGGAPKFPQALNLSFCLSRSISGDAKARRLVEKSLRSMALGGIYDQVGGGFARYSVDPRWEIPHFEKMLYDNAQLARLYLWAGLALESPFFTRIATETLDYLAREMRDESGGFYSSTDADSGGVEGKYFTWSYDEFCEVAGTGMAAYFGVTPEGNLESVNVLTAAREMEALDEAERHDVLRAREALLARRAERVRPNLDDKMICAWNGLALGAFADAARALQRSDYLQIALDCAEFTLREMRTDGELRRTKGGKIPAFAPDYALLGLAYIAIFEATGDWRWVDEARTLATTLFATFRDAEDGLLLTTADDNLVARPKELLDNTEPSASAAGAELALRLGSLLGDIELSRRGAEIAVRFGASIKQAPAGFGAILLTIARWLAPPLEVVVIGDDLVADVSSRYLPLATLVTGTIGADPNSPLLAGKQLSGESIGYVCENYTCAEPVHDPAGLEVALDHTAQGSAQ